jgi:diguanylate cyclase (GGDEF)-like protein
VTIGHGVDGFWRILAGLLFGWLVLIHASLSHADTSIQSSAETVNISQLTQGHVSLGASLDYLTAPAQVDHIDELIQQNTTLDWQKQNALEPNFGFNPVPHWFRVQLRNNSDQDVQRLVELSYALLDFVDFYVVQDGKLIQQVRTGDQRSMQQRAIHHRHFLLPLDIPARSEMLLVMRVQTTGSLQLPLTLWDLSEFFKHDQLVFSFQIMFVGIMLGLALYNFLLFVTTRDISYLWYVASVSAITGLILCLYGIPAQFLWPSYPRLNNLSLVASLCASLVFTSLFTYYFLKLKRLALVIRFGCFALIALGSLIFVLNFFIPYHVAIRLSTFLTIFEASAAVTTGLYLWARGEVLARFYTTAWFAFFSGAVVLVLSKWGVIPRNFLVENILPIGCVIEGLLLSSALAYRMNRHRQKRFQSQSELLRLQQEANALLEQRVAERTAELEQANQKLSALNQKDGLTDLYNRTFFEEKLQHEWQKGSRGHNPMSLLMVDSDHFKRINDTYGHLCGDACLVHLAGLMQNSVNRAGDFVARYGGEEFVILLCHTEASNAALVAERIRQLVEKTPLIWQTHTVELTVSIGVAGTVPHGLLNPKTLLQAADQACYCAKRQGRNQVQVAVLPQVQMLDMGSPSSTRA